MDAQMLTLILITLTILLIGLDIITDEVKFKKFKSKIQVGTCLTLTSKLIGNEFDEGYTFTIQVIRLGKKQVQVKWRDGKVTTKDIRTLFDEHWSITDPQHMS